MGCDIHLKVEMYGPDEAWHRAEDVGPNQWYDPESKGVYGQKEIRQEWYDGRNYELFSVLAGVRGYGPPIIEPRGIPADVSLETKDEWNYWGGDAHTPHWYSLRELLIAEKEGVFDPAVYGQEFLTKVVDRMKDLANEELDGDGERIRIVLWFDN